MLQAYVHDFGCTISIREYSGHGRKRYGDEVHSLYVLLHPLRFIEAELGILWSWQEMDTQCIHLDAYSLKLSWKMP